MGVTRGAMIAETLAPPLSTLCGHTFLTTGQSGLYVGTLNGCDGPVIRIRAQEPVRQFTDPDNARGFKCVSIPA